MKRGSSTLKISPIHIWHLVEKWRNPKMRKIYSFDDFTCKNIYFSRFLSIYHMQLRTYENRFEEKVPYYNIFILCQNSRWKYLLIGILILLDRVDFWNTNCHADFLLGRSFKIISPTSVISRSSQLEPPLIQPQFIFYKFENTY